MPTPRSGYFIDGVKVPSVTQVLGAGTFMPSDALCGWAAKLAKAGKDWRKERDRAGFIGTAIHDAVEAYPAMPVHKDDYSTEEWERIHRAWEAHDEWWRRRRPTIVVQEVQLLSRELRTGGTPDLVARIDVGKGEPLPFLLDHKSGKSIGAKEVAQMAAYAAMLKEQLGLDVAGAVILHHPVDAAFRPVALTKAQLDAGLAAFKACRALYDSINALKGLLPERL